ncbi:MOSC domain-containing protein [Paenibacillus flagellatus]|uniref:MOSC domain-containing protein n=1 Tax=Paenibacillus flagellatus TaxID=2211139 RepID=UPI0013053A7D|nr:MOSC domain-containing protein [Paenibacillus flagellatus]
MSRSVVGVVSRLYRYPVKSFAGESPNRVRIERYGLYGDRSHAFVDGTKQGWERYVTARQLPHMLAWKAEFVFGPEPPADEFPPLRITSPQGETFGWDERLLQTVQRGAKPVLSLERHRPDSADLLAVDAESVLIVTDRSLAQLERSWGKSLDPRRFRPNLIVKTDERLSLEDGDWIGRTASIGEAELLVRGPCERCTMITIDPDTLERSPALLKTVNAAYGLCFGLYATVVKPGDVKLGDAVAFVG